VDDPVDTALDDAEPQAVAVETVEPQTSALEAAAPSAVGDARVPLSQVLAEAGAFDRPRPADAPRDASEDAASMPPVAPSASQARGSGQPGRRRSRHDRAAAKASSREAKRDRIVEAPREPKMPLSRRLRSPGRSRHAGGASRASGGGAKRLVSLLAGLIGAVGLVCSVVLAFGALLVALDATGSSVYDSVSPVCDVLVGPLRDVFSFTGTNADMKESLVAWGAGAIAYLIVGFVAQSLLRSAVDD
jgi:hypothetical protein